MCGRSGARESVTGHGDHQEDSRPTLGRALRDIRLRRGWTLRQTSERVGITVSSLSKIENNRLTLTYDKLFELSRRLNIRVSELFRQVDPPERVITGRRSIGRQQDATRVSTPNCDRYYLCDELKLKRMTPILNRIRTRSPSDLGGLERHSGEEYVHVLEGRIAVHTEFYDVLTVDAGEGVYIDSTMGHAYVAAEGCDEAIVLAVCSSAGSATS
jgi:transcriptional regulator with XRE-family HTH domain